MARVWVGAAILALGCAVAALAVLVGHGSEALFALDASVGAAVVHPGGGGLSVGVLQVLTAPGLTVFRVVVLVPIALLFAIRRRPRVVGFILLAAAAVGPLTTALKEVVGRVRPTYGDPLVAARGLSFPSGHSSGAAVLAGVLLVLLWPVVAPRWRAWLSVAAVLGASTVAWTRLALGVHYLSDAVAGLALGAATVLVAMAVFGLYRGGAAELPVRGWPQHERGHTRSA